MNKTFRIQSTGSRVAGVVASLAVTFVLLQSVTALFQSAPDIQMAKAAGATRVAVATTGR